LSMPYPSVDTEKTGGLNSAFLGSRSATEGLGSLFHIPLIESRPTMDSSKNYGYGDQQDIAPSFLFGERNQKRKALALNGRSSTYGSPGILKKDLSSTSPGKNVRWSTDLVQEQLFSSKPTTNMISSPVLSPFAATQGFSSTATRGPPLSSLDSNDFEPPQKLQRPDNTLDHKEAAINAINNFGGAFTKPPDPSDFWVTVFGFSAGDKDMVLSLFSRHGNIVNHNLPRLGNWVHLRYSSTLHAQQALKRNGNIIGDRLKIGVEKCTDKEVVSDTKVNPLNTSTNNFVDISFGNPELHSTFKHAHEPEQFNGTRGGSLSFADAASFNRSRLSALSRNGMRSLRATEVDVSLDTSNRKDESFLGKLWSFVAPQN